MSRSFNTAGPCKADIHYVLPPLARMNLPELELLTDRKYLSFHAPLDKYLAGLGLKTGWLVIFDRRPGQPPLSERTKVSVTLSPGGRTVAVLRA